MKDEDIELIFVTLAGLCSGLVSLIEGADKEDIDNSKRNLLLMGHKCMDVAFQYQEKVKREVNLIYGTNKK